MDILHSFFHLYLHNIFVKVQLILKVIPVQTRIKSRSIFFYFNKIKKYFLTSSPKHPRVFVLRHSIKRSAIVQNARILPFVA